ncbi:MAG TPA: cyanophycin synthetase, partial [Candidatus Limnocylindrales bacterium]|nr:cyanophycin synthetase [Candidatus Limnocylindrales bacterium]
FVVEADEYAGNFDPYRPEIAVLTSAEWDHPDVFPDRAAVIAAFDRWVRRMTVSHDAPGGGTRRSRRESRASADRSADPSPAQPTLVANVGDLGVAELVERLRDWPGRVIATASVDVDGGRVGSFLRGIAEQFRSAAGPAHAILGRITATDPNGTALELVGLDPLRGAVPVRLRTAGRHNVANALGVIGAAVALGVETGAIVDGIASFEGVGRRLERKGEVAGVVVFDDYGHHPTAIRETLGAVRQRAPGRRVWAVYEPLTFHRTAALLDDFAEVLAGADAVAVADIWAGRDPDTTIASAERLARAVAARNPAIPVAAPGSVEATAAWLAQEVRSGDAVLVMGGGRSYRIGALLLEALADR